MNYKNLIIDNILIYANKEEVIITIKNITELPIYIYIRKDNIIINPKSIVEISYKFDEVINVEYEYNNKYYNHPVNLSKVNLNGFGENSIVVTNQGNKKIKDLKVNDIIINNYGVLVRIKNIFLIKINKFDFNQPILIKKSSCGINIPDEDFIISIKNDIHIKNIILKGRNLFLSKKAVYHKYNNEFIYYNLEIEDNSNFFVNGFSVRSFIQG